MVESASVSSTLTLETSRKYEIEGSVASSFEHSHKEYTLDELDYSAELLGQTEHCTTRKDDFELELMLSTIETLSYTDSIQILKQVIESPARDRNFPEQLMQTIQQIVCGTFDGPVSPHFAASACAALIKCNSPYPEVRSVVDPWDDGSVCETIRMYIVGLFWLVIVSGVNYFFSVRNPSLSIQLAVLQLFMAPSGWLLSRILPDWGFTLAGTRHSLNPGPWSKKEQSAATMLASMSGVYSEVQILVQKLDYFYGDKWANAGYQILFMLSTQLIGFGISGMFRQLLIYPTQCLWFANFPTLAINQAVLSKDNSEPVHGWRLTRWQWFGIVSVVVFCWQWVTEYLFSALQFFNWMTWIAPQNFNLATITGGLTGLGINPIPTFDFNVISSDGFYFPLYTVVNYWVGAAISSCVAAAVYWTNTYWTAYLPCSYNTIFTNTGVKYDVKQVLTDNKLDEAKYQKYSPAYYGAASLVNYGAQFALHTCAIVWSIFYDGRVWVTAWRDFFLSLVGHGKTVKDFDDPHSRMMAKYPETPQWWFMAVLLVSIAMGIMCLKIYPTGVPVWSIFLGLALSIFFLVPNGLLMATTNTCISLNVLSEIITGYAAPGSGLTLMVVKVFAVNTHTQALHFLQDLKFGHYTKVPPRVCFKVQVIGSIISVFVVFAVLNWQVAHIDGLCTPALRETNKFTCPIETSYFAASVVFGVIGPKRFFDTQYPVLKWCFLIGCFIPVPFLALKHLVKKKQNWIALNKLARYSEPTIMLIGMYKFTGARNLSYITPTLYVSLFMMLYVRKRFLAWFQKYNFMTAGAIDTGIALSTIIIFFAVQYHPVKLNWWGNTVQYAGIDGTLAALKSIPKEGYFGAAPGSY